MILPFVREIFAELEQSSSFDRVRRHLSLGVGRRRVSGLTNTARSLYIPLLARAAKQPVIVVVADNKAAEALELTLRAGCELTGAVDPNRVVRLPAHDVLPFENLSPHPDVQEQRAAALFKLATGAVSILIAPAEAAALRLFNRDYYASLAVTVRRGEEVDVEILTGHLASVGYTQMDLVEMPGQFTRRGGILDIYSPEADRPVRTEFFEASDATSVCPYKGRARYWSIRAGDTFVKDVAWSYPDPIPENPKIRDLVAFFQERVDIVVDGEALARPATPWSTADGVAPGDAVHRDR